MDAHSCTPASSCLFGCYVHIFVENLIFGFMKGHVVSSCMTQCTNTHSHMTMHQHIRACTFQLSHAPLRWPVVSPGARAPCSASSAIKDAASNRTRSSLTRTRLARAIAVRLRQGVAHAHYVESQVRRRLGRDLTKICDQSVAASS